MPGLIVDFDGLIIDSERVLAEAVIELIAARGGTITTETFGHLFGSTAVDDEWERMVPTWCEPPLTLVEVEEMVWPGVHEIVDALPLLPGVAELLDAAADAGWKLALATGHSADRLHPRLERLGLSDRFEALVLASHVARGKPAPDIFLEAARRLDLRPGECVVAEDSLPGCEAALAAGMSVVVCPSVVTAHLTFPATAHRVASLVKVATADLERLLGAGLLN